jgi:Zn ribbon nucleic-acid-binding protein
MANPAPNCAICLSPVASGEETAVCPACQAVYHADCWRENGGCAIYGCAQVPVVEKRQALEIPVSYWGQENKQCPSCGREILAAALRCRHCGAIFESARPQATTEFQQRTALARRLPAARRQVIVLFVLCAVPFLAPVGAVATLIWRPAHREDLRALPSFYAALSLIGLVLAIGLTLALILVTLLYSQVHH